MILNTILNYTPLGGKTLEMEMVVSRPYITNLHRARYDTTPNQSVFKKICSGDNKYIAHFIFLQSI